MASSTTIHGSTKGALYLMASSLSWGVWDPAQALSVSPCMAHTYSFGCLRFRETSVQVKEQEHHTPSIALEMTLQ